MEDEKIVQLIWDRNENGINELSEKYDRYCFCISERIVHDEEDAKECVNDTWLFTWNSIPPRRPSILSSFVSKITIPPSRPSVLSTFLAKIVRNLSLNRYRDMHALKRGGSSVNIAIEELNECITDGKTVEKDMEYKLLTESIEDFLWKQTKRNRTVFLKRYFYVMDIKEIAEELDIKEGTVKSILSRMRKKLAVWLEKEAVV